MAEFVVKDGAGVTKYLYAASGTGATGDPWVPGHSVVITGNIPDTAAGDLAAIVAALGGTLTVDGSGVTQPVSGTVTANLSATDNAVLDTIETNTDSLTVVGGGTEATALRVTLASDSTGQVSITGNLPDTAAGDFAAIVSALGGTLTVSGTVDLGATDNAVLDSIASNVAYGLVTGGGVEATALRVTIASDSTGTLTVDDGGGALTVDGTVAVSGTVTVDGSGVTQPVSGTVTVGSITAGDNNIGNVDVASIAAGETHIGAVGASDTVVTITASLDTNAYTSGDVLFDTQAIANAARVSGGVVILQSVTVLDKDDQAQALDLVFLDANTSLGTENAAVSIADAGAEDILGVVSITADDYADLINSQVATKSGIGLEMKADASTSLYVAGITRGTPTHTASGIMIKFAFLRS